MVSPSIAQIVRAIRNMTPLPVIIHVISPLISNTVAAGHERPILGERVWPTSIQAAIACIMAINEDAALPTLISTAAGESSGARVMAVDEHI